MSDYMLTDLTTFKHPEGKWYYIAALKREPHTAEGKAKLKVDGVTGGPGYLTITAYGKDGVEGQMRVSATDSFTEAKDSVSGAMRRRLAHGYELIESRDGDNLDLDIAFACMADIGCVAHGHRWREEGWVFNLRHCVDEPFRSAILPKSKVVGVRAELASPADHDKREKDEPKLPKTIMISEPRSGAALMPSCSDWRKRLGL